MSMCDRLGQLDGPRSSGPGAHASPRNWYPKKLVTKIVGQSDIVGLSDYNPTDTPGEGIFCTRGGLILHGTNLCNDTQFSTPL